MMNLLLFIGFLMLDLLLGIVFKVSHLLLCFPLFQFLNGQKLSRVLLGAFFASLLSETVHGFLPGTLLWGVGLGIACVHLSVEFLNWSTPIVQVIGGVAYFTIIVISRLLTLTIIQSSFHLPELVPWLMTLAFFIVLIFIRHWLKLSVSHGERFAS